MTEMFTPPERLAKRLLRAWLRSAAPLDPIKITYAYHKRDAAEIPAGCYAVVSVEIKPIGGEPLYEAPPWSEEAVYD